LRPLAGATAGLYEQVAYPGYVYPATHPARLEVLGRLFGLEPAPAAGCHVLELGCGDGGNALAIAQTLPAAQVIGIDAAAAAIERGQGLATAAGLTNVELRVADLADPGLAETLGPVDYLVAHGVYSWIPPAVRGALLDCARRCLAAHGIAFVSYNAYPGSYLRDMTRDILSFHLRGIDDPGERIARAQALMQTIVAVETPSPYARVLREHLQRMLSASEALLFHDDLAPVSTPFYFHEFIEHATAHELQFLSEADLSESQMRDVPGSVGELIASLPPDVIVREQYLDFFSNRMFRQTLLVHSGAPVNRVIDDRHLEGMAIASPARWDGERFVTPAGAAMSTSAALVSAAMHELGDCWPASLTFAELAARAGRRVSAEPLPEPTVESLRRVLLDAYLGRIVELHGCVLPVSHRAGQRPRASPLARAQSAAGRPALSTLLPGNCLLESELERRLLPLLDGSRDRASLAVELELAPEQLEEALTSLAGHALLYAD
jgi:SAM-dependent methyltransferase